jgi:hypothetical protein
MTGKIIDFNLYSLPCDISWFTDFEGFAMVKMKSGNNEIILYPLQAVEAIEILAKMASEALAYNQENGFISTPRD